MDENVNIQSQGTSANQQDAFLAGWNDEADVGEATETEVAENSETTENNAEGDATEQAAGAEEETPNTSGESKEEETETKEDAPLADVQKAADPGWTVTHNGETTVLKASDVTPELLQKGLDYDRIREKYDKSKPVMAMFSDFANKAGMSVEDYVRYVRAEAKKANGMSDEEAKRAVELEDREAAVSAKEKEQEEKSKEDTAQKNAVRDKVSSDLAEFEKAFPDVFKSAKSDPDAIPKSVWDDVNGGMTLTAAYAKYAVAQAREAAKVAEKAQKNAQRTTGSMKSAGSDAKNTDPFLSGFNSYNG